MTCEELSRILLQMANAPSGSQTDLQIHQALDSSETIIVYFARSGDGQAPMPAGASLADGGIFVERVQLLTREGQSVVECDVTPHMQRTIAILLDMLRTRGDIPVRRGETSIESNGVQNQISLDRSE
jgi:hypothetical protein